MARFSFLTLIMALGSYSPCQTEIAQSLIREVEDNSRYKTLEANATLLKLLVNEENGVSGSEVFDMLHSRDEQPNHVDVPAFPQDTDDRKLDISRIPDSQAEVLQGSGDFVRRDSLTPAHVIAPAQPQGEPVGLAAIIMVAVTCSVVCGAYASLIVWRRIYMKRNGLKHELLRNEDIAETRIEL